METAVGRERELDKVASIRDPAARARVLLLEGEPGIGKATVQCFAGTATSPNGQYSIGDTDARIVLFNGRARPSRLQETT